MVTRRNAFARLAPPRRRANLTASRPRRLGRLISMPMHNTRSRKGTSPRRTSNTNTIRLPCRAAWPGDASAAAANAVA